MRAFATAMCLLQQGQSEREGGKREGGGGVRAREREREKATEGRVVEPEAVLALGMKGETKCKGKNGRMRVHWQTGVWSWMCGGIAQSSVPLTVHF